MFGKRKSTDHDTQTGSHREPTALEQAKKLGEESKEANRKLAHNLPRYP